MDFDQLADCHKALGDKTRLRILALLKEEDLCVGELVEILKMTQPAVSQHVRKLRQARLVRERRQGQWVFYSLDGRDYPFFLSFLRTLPDQQDEIQRLKAEGKKGVCD
ncbi:MAG: metalloregulator ArsR/SmtB family transcription factor [Firmicutes bacterium]|uniref:ArsR family transcriptional regulator n=1 Tax=Melghirimyces thermohalophilus TaxID=1236220 RepID=A0A1G6LCT7_9BACL|nr:metalloregulator ArsR/SmtB family transcription factor [Melghirimyces thermohalophilus]MDA8353176.1 metalloregulator ArsR/SmtB family transcription factor [Bacillota bacterium]SDC40747.1 ArsR family transcriptional regulator [Melghirimyces thermohalophilus]